MKNADFEADDPKQPATLFNVAAAIANLHAYDETQLAELIAEGRLGEVFPFRVRSAELPPDQVSAEDIVSASVEPMDDIAYGRLLQACMPPAAEEAGPIERARRAILGSSAKPIDWLRRAAASRAGTDSGEG